MADDDGDRAAIFEAERDRLTAAAYRMLGSVAEAEDAVQDTWLRFAAADLGELRQPRAWLTTVVARICLDVLRSARVRREAYVGPWLPEPLVARLPATDDDPADVVARGEEVGTALLVVLERLTPEQRVAFVLHDVFAVPFGDIAATLGTSPEAARQLATRARKAVQDGEVRRSADLDEQRRTLTAFLEAANSGDFDALLQVLAPDVVFVGDGGGVAPAITRPLEGAVPAARFMLGLFRRAATEATVDIVPVLVNGDLGLLIDIRAVGDGALPAPAGMSVRYVRTIMSFAMADGRIHAVYNQLNPTKLRHLPELDQLRTPAAN